MNLTDSLKPAIRHAGTQLSSDQMNAKLQAYLTERVQRAAATVKNIMEVVPQDRVIKASALEFEIGEKGLEYFAPGVREQLHRNALTQLATRLEIPMAYVDHLADKDWGRDLLAKDLREHTLRSGDRYLVRSVGGEARAVLSDKFRRIDCRPAAAALLDVAQERGLIVSDGIFSDTRTSLKFILPKIIEVFPGEGMVFGFDWSNSDFGRGANDLRMFAFRPLCWNGLVGESVVRQIHIGKRLEDDVSYSDKTLKLDAEATASALRDTAMHALSEVKIERLVGGIRAANETKIEPKNALESLRKQVTKGDAEKVVEAFNSPDVENMPAGNTLWRWTNAITFVAGQLTDADKRIDFERIAGETMKRAMPKEVAAAV